MNKILVLHFSITVFILFFIPYFINYCYFQVIIPDIKEESDSQGLDDDQQSSKVS